MFLYGRAKPGGIFCAEDIGITATEDISGLTLVKMLISTTKGTVLLDPLPHLHGVQFGVVSCLQVISVAGCALSNEGQKFTYIYIYIECSFLVLSEPCSFLFSVAVGFCGRGRGAAGCVKGHPGFLAPFLQTLRSSQTITNVPSQVSP